MTKSPIMHDDAPPAAVLAGSGDEFGSVDLTEIMHAHDMALDAYRQVDAVEFTPGSPESVLRDNLKHLADAVMLLSGQVGQIARGARAGVIAVHD